MKLDEFERMHIQNIPPEKSGEWEECETEDQAIIDIKEAIELFATVKTMLDFIGNPDLCKGLTKRERDTMAGMSERVRSFLASVEPTYSEEEDE